MAPPRLLIFHSRASGTLPTFFVIECGRVLGRIVDPGGCKAIERFLAPWLR